MPENDQFCLFTDRLNMLGCRYAITGSVAGAWYGQPRLTLDVDIVLELSLASVETLCSAFGSDEFYCPPPEIVRVELLKSLRGHFNLIHIETAYKADIFLRGRDPLHAWALNHARNVELDNHSASIAPPEYVILRKLEYYREGHSDKHLRDIHGMITILGASVDHVFLDQKIAELGLEPEWKLAINYVDPPP
jgi:hypothetical protein